MDALTSVSDLGRPATILNLRRGADERTLQGVRYLQVAAANDLENYDTTSRKVRNWLGSALTVLADPHTAWPVYLHCTSGRDRTGVVVASALLLIGVPKTVVIEEYLLSEGAERSRIQQAIEGILSGTGTLGVNTDRLRLALCGTRGES